MSPSITLLSQSLTQTSSIILLMDIQKSNCAPKDILSDLKHIAHDLINCCFWAQSQRERSKKGILFSFKKESFSSFISSTKNGMISFYYCLNNGFENIARSEGGNFPYDEYGLSMIAIPSKSMGF